MNESWQGSINSLVCYWCWLGARGLGLTGVLRPQELRDQARELVAAQVQVRQLCETLDHGGDSALEIGHRQVQRGDMPTVACHAVVVAAWIVFRGMLARARVQAARVTVVPLCALPGVEELLPSAALGQWEGGSRRRRCRSCPVSAGPGTSARRTRTGCCSPAGGSQSCSSDGSGFGGSSLEWGSPRAVRASGDHC